MTSPTGRPPAVPHSAPHRLERLTSAVTTTVALGTAGTMLLLSAPAADPAETAERDHRARETRSAAPTLRLVSAGVTTAARPAAVRWPGHPGRNLVRYRVRPGDTATGLAVRFHAWTAELRAINHLGRNARLYVGERIRIPVVVAAARRAHAHRATHRRTHRRTHRPTHGANHRATHRRQQAAPHRPSRTRAARPHRARHPWGHPDASRTTVRAAVVHAARRHGVRPSLALAIAWQESGWQQRRISSAHAVGAMQVLPATAAWMSLYVGRRLNAYALHDNVDAGAVLISVLQDLTRTERRAIGAYYQGLGSVREHGLYRSTKAYVRNVTALDHRIARGANLP